MCNSGSKFLIGAAALALACPVAAQSGDLPGVAVTATRQHSRVDQLVADVTVVDRDALERTGGRTLSEVLAQQPGIQMSSNGGPGAFSSVFLRGLEGRHVLLIVDGVRLGSATVGAPSLDNIPVGVIDRIEIVRGPLSGLYGSDAVGGVIQVFTRRGTQGVQPYASVTGGSNRFGQVAGGVTAADQRWDLAAHVQRTTTRGFSATNVREPFGSYDGDRDAFRQTTANLRGGLRLNDAWRADARLLQSEGTVRYDDGPGVDSRARLRNQVASVEVSGRVTPAWNTVLRLGRSTDEYDTLATASPFTDLGVIRTAQRQLTWENTLATPLGSVLLLAEQVHQDVGKPASQYDVTSRTINGVAAGLNGQAGAHSWQLSARHDRNSQFGSQNTGRLGYAYRIDPHWRVSGALGTSFVAPSFNQLYFPFFSNPNLLPEEGRHAELGVNWTSGPHTVRASWFDNRIRGYITSGAAPVNIPRSRIDGVSLAYEAKLGTGTRIGASYDHVDPRNDTEGTAGYGRLLPRRARDAVRFSADHRVGRLSVGATVVAFSHRYDDTANTRRLAGYATMDLRADWRIDRQWTLGLRLNNLANRAYETAFGFNQPGREAYVTLRYAGG